MPNHVQVVREFLTAELEQRQISGLKPYIRRAEKALASFESIASDHKGIIESAKAVQKWDSLHGFGADDEGYNLLATLWGCL